MKNHMSRHRRTGATVGTLSPDEFAAAFHMNARPLWCIVAGVIGRSDLIEDVLQDAAMIALSKLDQFDASTSFLAWMGQIARFTALNYGRREHRHRSAPVDLEILPAPPSPAAAPDMTRTASSAVRSDGRLADGQSAFDDEVQAALTALDETARACLLLRVILDMPYREIAVALDIPEGTAMSHVHRARHAMRDRLGGRPATAIGTKETPRTKT